MITNLQSFEINSFYCKANNGTSDISYYLDVPQDFLEEVTHFSVISATIPNTWTQLDDTDILGLVEGDKSATFNYPIGSYYTKQNMMSHLQQILNQISPNRFTYTVQDNSILLDDKAIHISCNDTTLAKNIVLNGKYLKLIYGLGDGNPFTSSLVSKPTNLYPISTIHIHSNISASLNSSGLQSNDIIASVNVDKCGTEAQFDIISNMKPFSKQRNLEIRLTDFDNYYLDLYDNHWVVTIAFFTYREGFIDTMIKNQDYSNYLFNKISNHQESGLLQLSPQ